ncbi:non-ribosomal peptide synthetase/type I polyketide synthase [Paenibacillus wynnii]|uniref:non-ribosomal peptide synthetase/type I polyketide synthase n=1 Tax=Paenibacillus wynnii TaxID=268407 RepID=UPI00278FE3A0|nr:non-ribosomal peptide synthetase/type I polyketide synthase [Paenibacillus wynnii]MDQ0191714.1 amino acid adenylation domain-containing protein [Paenibacillus wynnii]
MITKRVELSETQKGIYFDCQIDNPISYNISATLLIEGLQEKHFESALKLVIGEQEALRSSLEMVDDLPVLAIHDRIPYVLVKEDFSDHVELRDELLRGITKEECNTAFDFSKAPLFRTRLIQLEEHKYLFLICIHHIISDGLSLEIFKTKLLDYYSCLVNKKPMALKQDTGFSEFIERENSKLLNGKYSKQKEYWSEKMRGSEPLALQPDYSVRHKDQGIGKEKRFEIPSEMIKAVHQLSMDQEVTDFMFFMAAFTVLMNQYTRNDDIIFSSPFSYRPSFDLEETMGCFVHMLPMRFNIESDGRFTSILQQVSQELIQVYRNIGYPNNLIVRDSQLVPMPGSPSIFDVSFVYDIYEETEDSQLKIEVLDQDIVTFPGSLMVVLNKTPNQDLIKIQYKSGIFSDEMIELLGLRFLKLLEVVIQNVEIPIGQIDLLLENEKKCILQDFNATSYFPYQPQHIMDVLHSKVIKHPDHIALIEGEKQETYASVNAKANQLARKIAGRKRKANEAIGVQLHRSMNLVISLLAILKAGCAYVPIDPAYPAARKEYIFEDADIKLLITSSECEFKEDWNIDFLSIDDPETYSGDYSNLAEELDPFSLAYIMYTSGSTGKPKGVMVENHSVVNTLMDLERRFPLGKDDVYLLKTSFTFDVSATEFFGWFMGEGALLVLEPDGEKNPQFILNEISKHAVTHINFVPTMFRLFLELFDMNSNLAKLNPLRWIFVGGEAVTPDILQKFNALQTNISLENVYGPTECTIWVSHYSLKNYNGAANVPIGQPLNESRWYVVGNNEHLQPVGIPGELCLSGVGLARGYLNMTALTEEKFVPNPFFEEGIDPECYRYMYRTGDLVRWLPSGTIEYLGRIDFQVKVRGVRLEVGEIENALSECEGIVQAVVVVKKQEGKPGVLCAYYLSENEIPVSELKDHLSNSLPAYMIPSFFVHKTELPHNNSGKIDRNALIADLAFIKETSIEYVSPGTELESQIASVWQEVLSVPLVGLDDNFFEIGGNSLSLIQVHNKLRKLVNLEFTITLFFQAPTVRLLAEHFSKTETEVIGNREAYFKRNQKIVRQDIAIIGMSVHVPGAENVFDFWDNLKNEKESIHFYQDDELKELGIDSDLLNSANYVKAKGRLQGVDYFDPQFFGYTPGEVRMMSPQLRLLYQGTWEALEDAGYFPNSDSSKIGMFMGGSDDFEWYKHVLFGDTDFSNKYQAFTLSTNHFLASRVSYKLDIKGPVFSALTGCSTTLVTPHLACQSLILGECDLAVAGGITIELPNDGGYLYEDGMMFSPDGHCRPFDAQAQGTVFSNGMGLVVLKRLDEALEDGDQIYAVIKGSAINNDGNQKVGFLAPSVTGQTEVIQEAYRVAGIDPETVSYVEAHGTGTLLGDPIEVESLSKAFASDKKQFCVLGSVKGNVGHTDTAAGVVGLAKVALSLKHKYIPGTVNYQDPNPKIDFKNTPFMVKEHGTEWGKEPLTKGLLRAGINSFGVGGTNAHMVLEEPPVTSDSSPDEQVNVLPFSAKSAEALRETSKKVVEYLLENPGTRLTDAAWTLQVGRMPFPYRSTLVINESFRNEPERMLKNLNETALYEVKASNRKVYFMFPGQGSQYQGMGRDLYHSADRSAMSKIFKRHIDQVFDLLKEEERAEFKELIYGDQHPHKINQTEYSQFALFATSYALAKTLMELGIQPAGMIGHSIGEVTAAAVAGVFALKDAVEIVRIRGQVMQKQEPGVMLAVMADAGEVEKELEPNVWLALENTTRSCVVGGSEQAIVHFERKLEKLGLKFVRVKTSHAFHTPMMEQAAQEFQQILAQYTMNEPLIPIVSNTRGTWVQEKDMTNPEYWSKHILKTVKFSKNLSEILKNKDDVFIEVGAGRTLSTFARQHESRADGQHFINLIRHPQEIENDVEYTNKKFGEIWCAGIQVDWVALKGSSVRKRLSLPTYVFDKVHFPIHIQTDSSQKSAFNGLDTSETKLSIPLRSVAFQSKGGLESTVIDAYKTVFGFDTISVDQNFFTLGGDSLKAVSLSSAIKNVLGIKVEIADLFKYPSPGALASFLSETEVSKSNEMSIRTAPKMDGYTLSSAQSRMFALSLLDKDNVAYNLPSATMIRGPLDKGRVEQALDKLIQRHESLRTTFRIRDNQPVQIIHSTARAPITYSDKTVSSHEDIRHLIYEFIKPFDLEKAPLFRVELINTGVDNYLLLFDLHHIIADGTSVEIITRDFNELYFGELAPAKIQYKDFAVWQRDYLKSQEIEEQKEFWLQQLGDHLPVLELPIDFKRPPVKDFAGSRIYFDLDRQLTSKLVDLAQTSEATLFMIMLSAWNILLARYSGQEDIIVGTPVAGRTQEEIEETVGMFVNMLAMRNHPENGKRFIDFLNEVKENSLKAFENQNYQFDELVEQLNLKRELSRNPLFDVCFDFQNMEVYDLEINGIRFTPYSFETNSAAYDLVLTCQENKKDQVITGFFEYSTGLFKKETVERMARHFREILIHITQEKDVRISDIGLLPQAEKQFILKQFNNTTLKFNENLLIQEMFEHNVQAFPDKTALIVSSGKKLTYRELNDQSNALAWRLIELGIHKDSLVGIMPRRDEYLLISILGVLKAGGAYVPIDPGFPEERIAYMLSECEISTLICSREYRDLIHFEGTIIDCKSLDTNSNLYSNPSQRGIKNSLACVIFTSGSTGRPKGVLINQESIVNFIHDIKNREIFRNHDDRMISVTTLSFDIFGFESLVPLCTGHSVYLADEIEQLDPSLANQKIIEHKVTHILSTVSRIKAFVENPDFDQALKQLKCILSGGENYPVQLLQDLQKRSQARFFNMYGPTETTIWSTTKELTHSSTINIGQPIANTQAYIMNTVGKLQPIGVYGELYIAGHGLARGYLNNPEETKDKFIEVSDLPGILLYKTGDRARLLDNGEIELLGRLDSQIKIRGYRIELTEIEKMVLSHENIRQAVLTVIDDKRNNKQLVLHYCTKREVELSSEDSTWLKGWLRECLPHYMVPSYFIHLDEMPVLPNGKINRNALILPQEESRPTEVQVTPPSSELERALLEAWKEVLNVERLSVRDNFFDVGGNSLGLILINNKLNSLIGRSIPLMQLFQHPTIESLVKSLGVPVVQSSEVRLPKLSSNSEPDSTDIAVIGMSCKFPGADDLDSFWRNIVSGKESITYFDHEELLESGVDPELLSNPNYVRAKGFLEGIEYFDSEFFDYPYQESNMMDPQIRILHQCVWEALEHAGYNSSAYKGRVGLFAGSGSSLPWMTRFLGNQNDFLSAFEALTLNEKDYLTTRVSYKLNLKGPSFNIQTACSTSLVAIHQAVQSLISGESDMAIAGGVSISYPRKEGYLWHEGMILSKDGHCRPFAEDSSGTVSGNGCGIVLLKPLAAAVRDGDKVYAVIKGSAINNDGIEKIGYTAPSVAGQAYVIDASLKKAGVSPEEINYLEAHGTGTKLGDPIEIEALKQSWNTDKKGYCAIGSVKANIGHLDAAAGVAGFIKTVLTLYHRTIPPLINYNEANPMIDFDNSPFYINTEAKHVTDTHTTLRAGVSSFGIGGTNVHVILEQPPMEQQMSILPDTVHVLPFSARSLTALANTSEAVLSYLENTAGFNLSDVAWTLQDGRKSFEYRKVLVVNSSSIKKQENNITEFLNHPGQKIPDIKKSVIFMFSGEESYYQGMAHGLYFSDHRSRISEVFGSYMDHVLSFLQEDERVNSLRIWSGSTDQTEINPTGYNQLLTFTIGYSLGKTLIQTGVVPNGVMGQNIGEICALTVAGVLELEDAIDLVRKYNGWLQHEETGSLIAAIAEGNVEASERSTFISCLENIQYNLNQPWVQLLSKEDGSLEKALAEKNSLFLEVGAGNGLQALLTQHWDEEVVHLIRHFDEEQDDLVYLNQILGQLWCKGVDLDWTRLKGESVRKRVPLPTYVFDKKFHENDVSLYNFASRAQDSSTSGAQVEADCSEKNPEERVTNLLSGIWREILGCDEVRSEDDFFVLGGHSLKAISLAAQIQKSFAVEMPLTVIFARPVFNQMVDWLLSNGHKQAVRSILPVQKRNQYEVSSAQKRMYVVNEMIGNAVPYNLASIYLVHGLVDREKFVKVIDELVHRHESLRTRFQMIEGEVVQIIEENVASIVEFGTAAEDQIEAEVQSNIRPFDLSKAPLLRMKLITIHSEKHVLFIDMHHIISDQSSIAILLQEFAVLYRGEKLNPLDLQYKDFAAWQNEIFKSKEIEKQIAYWKDEFTGEIPKLNMLTDFRRPRIQTFEGDRVPLEMGVELSAKMNILGREYGLTPYMVLMSALKLVLWKYTGQNDLVVGTGIAGRRHADLDSIVGMFVNTLAIRSQTSEALTVSDYLQYMKEKMIKAYENQDCQYEMLVEMLELEKDMARNPLFDVVINYINMGTEELAIGDLELSPWPTAKIDCKFDITWTIQDKDGSYYSDIEYNTALFTRESIESFGNRLLHMLRLITAEPERKLGELSIMTPDEEKWLLDLNQTATAFPRDKTIIQLFEEQVQQNGHRTAIIWESEEISYMDLNNRANRLAEQIAMHNVRCGDKIAILLERGPLQIVSILGIQKSGCVYVPIDPEYPENRINFILEDSGSCLLLTQSELLSDITHGISALLVDMEPDLLKSSEDLPITMNRPFPTVRAEDPAYIMYTSGSTGTPKGTLISHRNVIRVAKETNFITIEPTDRLLQLSNYVFDGSVFDIFGALLNGASLVMIAKQAAIEIAQLSEFIEEQGISVFFVTTALFNMLVDGDLTCLKNVRKIVFGGEAASLIHARKSLEALGPNKIINGYGPTESTFFATYYPINKIEDNEQSVPIGTALSNTTLYILDSQGRPVPSNVPGELYIGGDGVGIGYLNRDELTREKFIENPFDSSEKLYRTGDLVWRMPSGDIGFIGRQDFQIKIRGFRVELGEIEAQIKDLSGVQDVIVVSQTDKSGSLYIAAYYTVEGLTHLEPELIRELLLNKMPDYMIPSRMMKLDIFPLTLNGKIDRKALPVIEEHKDQLSSYIAPGNELEQMILTKMQDILDNSTIGIKDDFFRFGGQSIKAIALVQSLSKAGIPVKVNEVFQYPTVEGLAALPEVRKVFGLDAKRKSTAPEQEINLNAVALHKNQIDSLVAHVRNTCSMISTMIASANRSGEFPLSPVQFAHASLGSSVSGFTTRIIGELDERNIREIFMNTIHDNQLLHCVINKDQALVWSECDISDLQSLIQQNIPYLDLREYTAHTKEQIANQLCSRLLLSDYLLGELPWRLCCLRLSQDTHYVIWGFDHTAFDGMSAEVIRHQLEQAVYDALNGAEGAPTESPGGMFPQKYQDYVALLATGPQGIGEQEIIDRFSLELWNESNQMLMEKLDQILNRCDKEIQLHIPLKDTDIQAQWWKAFDFIVNLLSEYTGIPETPIAIVNYGRSYYNQDFYNCVGEFLDIIPLVVRGSKPELHPMELIKHCQLHSINFLSLLFDPDLSKKFSKIADLLNPAYQVLEEPKPFVLFNFQGFVSKEEQEAFSNPPGVEDQNKLAKVLVTVNYDEENLRIILESSMGFNLDKLSEIMETKLDQYPNVFVNYGLMEAGNV